MPASQTAIDEPCITGGFSFLDSVFDSGEVAAAREGQEELAAGRANRAPEFAWPTPRPRGPRSWKLPYATFYRSELAALARSPRLLAAIARETGARSIRFWFDQLLWECPAPAARAASYHWHTERSRWKTCRTPLMVTAWVPLTTILPEMGPLTVVAKTAARHWLELPDGWEPHEEDILPSPAQPGDAALFCWHTVHGNPVNRSSQPRRAIALHFAIDSLGYQSHGKFSHSNERIVELRDGLPNFHDRRVCPEVWRAGD